MITLFHADPEVVRARSAEVREAFADLLADPSFEALVGRATADRSRMFGRIRAFSAAIEALGIPTSYQAAVPAE